MTDFAGVGICAPINAAVVDNAAADSSGEGHIEERVEAGAGAVMRFPQTAHVRIVIHDGRHAEVGSYKSCQIEIVPSANMRGQRHALQRVINRPSEADSTVVESDLAFPGPAYFTDTSDHP